MAPHSPLDPYAAPAAASITPAGSSRALHVGIIARAFLVSAIWSAISGASLAARFAFGLRRFGGIEYCPRVIALATTRVEAPSIAFLASALTAVWIVHRSSRNDRALKVERSLGLSLGVAMPLLYPANVASSLAAGATLLRVAYAVPFAVFASETRVALTADDVVFGAVKVAAYALFLALVARPALRRVASSRRGLFAELVIAALALYAASFVIGSAIVAALD